MNIELLNHCASDLAVANAARVSLDKWHDEFIDGVGIDCVRPDRDDLLIQFLMKNRHGSPFEHGYFQFRVEAPIFVLREWFRHRIGHSYNEWSGRYAEMEKKFYIPDQFREQVGKPGSYSFEPLDDPDDYDQWYSDMAEVYELAWEKYQKLLGDGVAKEQARMVLPLALYSKMIWSCNPRSLMHFLGLRSDPQAMQEIRELAEKAEEHFKSIMPVTYCAWDLNGRAAP